MPALFMAFDCLYARRKDLRVRALRVRRQVLEAEVEGRHHVLPARRPADAGLAVWAEVLARGYEGLVAKDLDVPGRTLAWLKVKQPHYARASAAGSRSGARGR